MAPRISNPAQAVLLSVRPSVTDRGIRDYDEPHYVVYDPEATAQAQLVVFLPGTLGKPSNASLLLGTVANQGYRVIGLEYDDAPAVAWVCPQNPSPACAAHFRQERIFGDDSHAVVHNSTADSIVNRLTKLLAYLSQHDSKGNWASYMLNGGVDWSRIVVSGLSQGAGMAAYLAKKESVARVVLFSSPEDYLEPSHALAPWISGPSATPPDRWFAEYHRRENHSMLISRAYRALGIPPDHIRVFNLDLPTELQGRKDNPYHGSTIRVPAYAPQWTFLFGHSP
ncbi:MAG: BPSS1187 family protein [Mycobacteriales bacterium]